jgi:hypothetical protein
MAKAIAPTAACVRLTNQEACQHEMHGFAPESALHRRLLPQFQATSAETCLKNRQPCLLGDQ